MEAVKIIHCSDFHFDTPFSEFDRNKAEGRREEIRENFSNIIALAKQNNVQVLLMSGDLFDNETVSFETISLMKNKFHAIPDTRIFISPGNHDPYGDRSYYNIIQWPSNVYIFKDEMEKVDIDELNLTVYGRGFSTSYEKESLLTGFKVKDDSRINIMVMHGEVVKGSSTSIYNPICEEQIEKSGLDYLALGHVHSFSGVNRSGNTYWSYCGCPEGRGFDELGSKGILLGEVGRNYSKLNFIETCRRKYEMLEVDVTGSQNYEDIILKVNSTMGMADSGNDISELYESAGRDIYKVILKGSINRDFVINTSVLCEKLRYHFYWVKAEDNTEPEMDYEEISKELTLKGVFVKKMLCRISGAEEEAEKEKLKKALRLGLNALELRGGKLE